MVYSVRDHSPSSEFFIHYRSLSCSFLFLSSTLGYQRKISDVFHSEDGVLRQSLYLSPSTLVNMNNVKVSYDLQLPSRFCALTDVPQSKKTEPGLSQSFLPIFFSSVFQTLLNLLKHICFASSCFCMSVELQNRRLQQQPTDGLRVYWEALTNVRTIKSFFITASGEKWNRIRKPGEMLWADGVLGK